MAEPAAQGASNLVRVRNIGQENFIDSYANQQYLIPGGDEVICSVEAACCWMGFPGVRDDPQAGFFPRRRAYRRLRARYGFHQGLHKEDDWPEMAPKLEVYTMAGKRVWMILDDPDGTNAEPLPPAHQDMEMMRQAFSQQQAELEELRKLIRAREAGEPTEVTDVPEDKPRKVAVGARRGAPTG